MAKGVHKPLAGTEEARRGGQATRNRYGTDFYRAIGKKGGETTKTKHGSDHYRTSGKIGGEVLKAQRGPEYYRSIARLSNLAAQDAKQHTASAGTTRRSEGQQAPQPTAGEAQHQLARERQARLAALPPATHVNFQQKRPPRGRQAYWYATWLDRETGKTRTLYLGKERPASHPCLEGTCLHPFRHNQPKKPAGRGGPPIGYRPSPETIERMRQAHLGKSNFPRKQAE